LIDHSRRKHCRVSADSGSRDRGLSGKISSRASTTSSTCADDVRYEGDLNVLRRLLPRVTVMQASHPRT
jgi:hypothetical protein